MLRPPRKTGTSRIFASSWNRLLMFLESTNESARASGRQRVDRLLELLDRQIDPQRDGPPAGQLQRQAHHQHAPLVAVSLDRADEHGSGRVEVVEPGPVEQPLQPGEQTGDRVMLLKDVALAAEPPLADVDQGRLDHPLDQLDRWRSARPAGRSRLGRGQVPLEQPVDHLGKEDFSSTFARSSARRSSLPAWYSLINSPIVCPDRPASPGSGAPPPARARIVDAPTPTASATESHSDAPRPSRRDNSTPVSFETAAMEYSARPSIRDMGSDLPGPLATTSGQ